MTGKVLENNTAGALVLILPLALAMVLLYKAWPFLLLFFLLTIAWKIWENYQWQQWCRHVNPFFNALIRENRGCLTAMDLSLKANLTGGSARRFLERKAEEYGAQRQSLGEKGTVYYFITASALGTIFDDSEPTAEEEEPEPAPTVTIPQLASAATPEATPPLPAPASSFAQLVELKEARQEVEVSAEITKSEPSATAANTASQPAFSLIQAELAKRLDINPSTLGRRKSEPDFSQWSQSKDPDGIAWKYLSDSKLFVPVEAGE